MDSERLALFDREGNQLSQPITRHEFEAHQRQYGRKATQIAFVVHILICDLNGRILIQRRSLSKSENPGLWDKSVGGHVKWSESAESAAKREVSEELGFDVKDISLVDHNSFFSKIRSADLGRAIILRQIDYIENFESLRCLKNGDTYTSVANVAVFNGVTLKTLSDIKPPKREIEDLDFAPLSKLLYQVELNYPTFTSDLRFLLTAYRRFLEPCTLAKR